MATRITKQQRLLFPFLQKKEAAAIPFTLEELSEASTYPLKESVLAKMSRHEWDPFIVEKDGEYFAQGTLAIDIDEFANRTSSRFRRGGPVSKEISTIPTSAAELLKKSSEEFLLAIEIFNRPTAPNRIEAFVVHFILGFEKLLKAHIIINLGESKIWTNPSTKRHTISIRDALKLLYREDDNIRLNLERIISLRDWAMHYMLEEELAHTTSRYFQSGVFNYLKLYNQTAGESAIKMNGIGLMSLVINSEASNLQGLTLKYGKQKAEAMMKLIEKYDTEIDDRQSLEFAVPLDISIGLVAKGDKQSFTLENIISGRAVFVDKLRDPKVTHPYRATDVIAEVNKRLKADYTNEQLKAFLPPRGKFEFNQDDFNSICKSENWKRDSNDYHFDHGAMAKDTYSDKVVDFIMSKIKDNSGYLLRVKKKMSGKRQKRKST